MWVALIEGPGAATEVQTLKANNHSTALKRVHEKRGAAVLVYIVSQDRLIPYIKRLHHTGFCPNDASYTTSEYYHHIVHCSLCFEATKHAIKTEYLINRTRPSPS